jgi:catalase
MTPCPGAQLQPGRPHALPARRRAAGLRAEQYGGPEADPAYAETSSAVEAGELGRFAYEAHRDDEEFVQAGALCRDVMSQRDRAQLVTNVVEHLGSPDVTPEVRRRAVEYWRRIDAVARGIGVDEVSDAA